MANPIATPDTAQVTVDGTLSATGNVLSNDTGSFALAVSKVKNLTADVGVVIAGTYGTIKLNADGTYAYALNNALTAVQNLLVGQNLTDVFAYTVSDGHGGTASSTLTVTVVGTNKAPVAVADAANVSVNATTVATGNVLANDNDPNNDPLAVIKVKNVATNVGSTLTGVYGTLTLKADGTYSYQLNNSAAAVQNLLVGKSVSDTFSYTITDGRGATATANLVVNVTGTNQAPVAVADAAQVTVNSATATSGNVLTNDHDPNADPLTVTAVKGVATNVGAAITGSYGVLTLKADGTYAYSLTNSLAAVQALASGHTLADTFSYTISDARGATATTNLVVSVQGTELPPTAVADAASVTAYTALSTNGNVLTNDSDPNGDPIKVTLVKGVAGNVGASTAGTYGSLTLNQDGSYTYTLNNSLTAVKNLLAGHTLNDVFAYTISDGRGGTSTANLTVTVQGTEQPPVAVADAALVQVNAVVLATGNVLTNDTDPNNDPLIVTNVKGLAANVGVALAGTYGVLTLKADGSYSYALNTTAANVKALTHIQVVADTFSYTISDGRGGTSTTNLVITLDGPNAAPVFQVGTGDSAAASITDVSTATNLTAAGTLSFNDADKTDAHTVTVNPVGGHLGTLTANVTHDSTGGTTGKVTWSYQVSEAAVKYLAAGETATDTFNVVINDGHGGVTVQPVTLTLVGINDLPTVIVFRPNDSSTASITDTGVATTLTANGTLSFKDVDLSDTHTTTVVNGANVHGTLTATPTHDSTGGGSGQITWTYQVNETSLTSLAAGETATDTFTVVLKDNHGGSVSQQVNVTLTGVNDPPLISLGPTDSASAAILDDFTKATLSTNGTLSFSDADMTDVHAVAATGQTGNYGTLVPTIVHDSAGGNTGTINWSYQVNEDSVNGLSRGASVTDKFVVQLTDGHGGVASQTVSVMLTGINHPPSALDIQETTTEGTSVTSNAITQYVHDFDGDPTTITQIAGQAVQPGQTVTLSNGALAALDVSGLTITYTPAAGATGTDSFSYTVSDGHGGTASANINVAISAVAQPATIGFGGGSAGVSLGSAAQAGVEGNGISFYPTISANGQEISFTSLANNLAPGGTGFQVYVKDLTTGAVSLVSPVGVAANGDADVSAASTLSPDGTKVAFYGTSSVSSYQVFVKDLSTGITSLVSSNVQGAPADSYAAFPIFSPDGTKVAFSSTADNLVPGATSAANNIYLKDLATGEVTLISSDANGAPSNNPAIATSSHFPIPSFSQDGKLVAFNSEASNLVAAAVDGQENIYVKNLATGGIVLASSDVNGVEGNGASLDPTLSPDGTEVAFYSSATNLIAGITVSQPSIYLKNLTTGVVTLVQPGAIVNTNLHNGGGLGDHPLGFSADGKTLVFESAAALTPGVTAGVQNVYLENLTTGAVTLVSKGLAGAASNGNSGDPAISADGTVVTFQSNASNLAANATGQADAFVARLSTPFTGNEDAPLSLPITVAAAQPGDTVSQVVLSGLPAGSVLSAGTSNADGSSWTLTPSQLAGLTLTPPTHYTGAFALNVTATTVDGGSNASASATQTVTISSVAQPAAIGFGGGSAGVSLASATQAGVEGNALSFLPTISADGHEVSFTSQATNLAQGATGFQIYVKDVTTGVVSLVSTNASGVEANRDAAAASTFSPDGTKVAFYSDATNLSSQSGSYQVYVKDLSTGLSSLVSSNVQGVPADSYAAFPIFSPDGTKVAFSSTADNLVPGATSAANNIYLKDLATGEVTLISSDANGAPSNNPAIATSSHFPIPSFSQDGKLVAFNSEASNLVAAAVDGQENIYVKNLATGGIVLASSDVNGVEGNGASLDPTLSPDGSEVAFYSSATNLIAGITVSQPSIYLKNLTTGVVTLVQPGAIVNTNLHNGGGLGDHPLGFSADGKTLVFESAAALTPGVTAGVQNVYLENLTTGAVTLVSKGLAGAASNGNSGDPAISADGTVVTFQSNASNLAANATGQADVFVARLSTPFTGNEDAPLSLPITVAAAQPGDTVSQVVLSGLPAGSVLSAGTSNADGSSWTLTPSQLAGLTLTPPTHYTGAFALNVTATTVDGGSNASASATQTVTISSFNHAPTLSLGAGDSAGAAITDNAGQTTLTASATLSFNDADLSDVHTVTSTSSAGNLGTLVPTMVHDSTGGGAGTINWSYQVSETAANKLVHGQTATDTFSVQVADGHGGVASQTVSVTLTGVNHAPVATNDSASTTQGHAVTLNVLANDTDYDSDPLTVTQIAGQAIAAGQSATLANGATTMLNADGTITYTPTAQASGTDSFAYTISDGHGGTASANVTVAIAAVAVPAVIGFGSGGGVSVALASSDMNGSPGNAGNDLSSGSTDPAISSDGSSVAFLSSANNLGDPHLNDASTDVFVKNLHTGSLSLVASNANGAPSISADGTRVAFESPSPVSGQSDLYVKDLTTGVVTLASSDSMGNEASSNSMLGHGSLSGDGTKLVFSSGATNLSSQVNGSNGVGVQNIFMKDLTSGEVSLVSQVGGYVGDSISSEPTISADGTTVAFKSSSGNLVQNVTDDSPVKWDQIYVKMSNGTVALASSDNSGTPANSGADDPQLSADGLKVVFSSSSTNLVAGAGGGGVFDVFVKDMTTGQVSLVGAGFGATISADGNTVVFSSLDPNLTPGDTGAYYQVYSKNLATGAITLLSTSPAGTEGDGNSVAPSVSADGTHVAFSSQTSNLVTGSASAYDSIDVATLQVAAFTGREDAGPVSLSISVSAAQAGDTVSQIAISGLPAGSVLSHGTPNADGSSWTLTPGQLSGLTLTPPLHYAGAFTLSVNATTVDGGSTANAAATHQVTITPSTTLAPIVLDLNHTGIHLSQGVSFDYQGNGATETGSWASSSNAFLVLDRSGDGKITGSDISFVQDKPGATTDLQGLQAFDSNHDGILSAADAQWGKFLVWDDLNQDGIAQSSELRTLTQAGITSISLTSTGAASTDAAGDTINGYAEVTLADGSHTQAADVSLAYAMPASPAAAAPQNLAGSDGLVAGTNTISVTAVTPIAGLVAADSTIITSAPLSNSAEASTVAAVHGDLVGSTNDSLGVLHASEAQGSIDGLMSVGVDLEALLANWAHPNDMGHSAPVPVHDASIL